jgi:hypothetical protein
LPDSSKTRKDTGRGKHLQGGLRKTGLQGSAASEKNG